MEHVDPFMGVILPYINFAIFVVLAWYFFRKPVAASTRQRREIFQAALADAKAAQDKAEQRLAELNARLVNLDKEIAEMKALSEKTARAEADKIVADATTLSARIKEEAAKVGKAEVERASSALRDEIVAAVKAGVEEKIKAELSPDAHLAYMRKQINGLKQLQ